MSTKKLKPSGEGWVQLIAGIGFVILLIAINIVDPTFYPTMWHLATSGSMDEIAEYIQGFGPCLLYTSYRSIHYSRGPYSTWCNSNC